MTTKTRGSAPRKDYGGYIVLNGDRIPIHKHETDFSVMAAKDRVDAPDARSLQALARNLTRVSAPDPEERDRLMDEVRAGKVAHHIYQVDDTGEEIVIADRVVLTLKHEGAGELERIMDEYHLRYVTRMGDAHVLRLTDATQRNPLKLANELAERDEVASCSPEVMLDVQPHREPALFAEQWYLTTDLINHPEVVPGADAQVVEAWEITRGDPGVVVAVIDDGIDLGHPAFTGVRLHPDARDFQGSDNEPAPGQNDFHGTPVASIAVGSHHDASPMRGVAPDCTLLPVRIGFGPLAAPIDFLEVFRFVSARADVVNCSFGLPPSSIDRMSSAFRSEITRLAQLGGRRGKGLVFVFSAGNDDAPTFLEANQNANGVKFVRFTATGAVVDQVPAGRRVFSGYPMTPGVVVAGAMSSRKRKSGYSSWGPHITVTAPSNNMHYIMEFIRPANHPDRAPFVADYRGLGQVAASNRPGHGSPFSRIRPFDDPTTPHLQEHLYTRGFGGTSGAAPVITGVVALMLSVNPDLTAEEVRNILMSTADTSLDPTLDLANDPNVQGLSGAFANGRSLWFGAGKVDGARAVGRAKALRGDGATPPAGPTEIVREAAADLAIPDRQPAGVASHIDVDAAGRLAEIEVTVDITHTWRGDLRVTLIAPGGLTAELHRFAGGGARDLKRGYTPGDTGDLADLAANGIDVRGRWTLHVADHVRRDVGRLNRWGLRLRTA